MKHTVAFLVALSILLAACGTREAPVSGAATGGNSGSAAAEKSFPPRKRASDHKVIVMLGEEYAKRPAILDPLVAEYGLSGYGGMTVPLKYPESFTVNSRVRLSALAEHAAVSGVTVVVTVGAPEGTVEELEKIRAINPSMRIVTLFPFDEILPVEAVSDIVAMNPRDDALLSDEGASNASLSADDVSLGLLVLASALSVDAAPASGPLASKADDQAAPVTPQVALATAISSAADAMKLGKNAASWAVSPWTDPDTGLKSRKNLTVSFARGTPQ